MPSNKIYTILVLCIGVVVSIWLLQKNVAVISAVKNTGIFAVGQGEKTSYDKSDEWNKILVNIQSKDQGITTTQAISDPSVFDETTVTAQMARDLFSRYLLIAKNGQNITPEDEDKIVSDVLSSPEYTNATGAVYMRENLHINNKNDLDTLKKYANELNQILKNRIAEIEIKESPTAILDTALKTENPDKLKDLDSIINSNKGIVSDLLQIEVPKEIVAMHLDLLNAISNILSNLEAMRVTFTDPVKSFVGVNQYSQHMDKAQTALTNINVYYKQRFSIMP